MNERLTSAGAKQMTLQNSAATLIYQQAENEKLRENFYNLKNQKYPPNKEILVIDMITIDGKDGAEIGRGRQVKSGQDAPRSFTSNPQLKRTSTGGVTKQQKKATLILKKEAINRGGSPTCHSSHNFNFGASPQAV
jgi:hypothetical protein